MTICTTERSSTPPDARMTAVEENYKRVAERIAAAALRSGRAPESVELVAVTKTVPVEYINRTIELGVRHIGENKVQELASKYDGLIRDELKISVIGHLQTNKVKQALSMADMIQSVDSEHLALEISKRAVEAGKTVRCLVEINIGEEESKTGVSAERAEELVYKAAEMPGLVVCGLMTIPPVEENILKTRQYFSKIYKLFIDISSGKHDNNIDFSVLSMGMSADFEAAIEEGANMVRVGSALYGMRY